MEVRDIKIEDEVKVKIERKDPTSFLPEEPMSYEIKKKKKKKKKQQEDPFKDIDEKMGIKTTEIIPATLDPEVTIKVENIEVELDFNDFADTSGLLLEGPNSEDSQEPAIKIENQNHEAVILTFESIINEKPPIIPCPEPLDVTPKAEHFCKVCHLVFQSTKTLRMHQKRRHKIFRKSFKHKCEYCSMSYETKNSLVAHIKRKHGPDSRPDDLEEKTCEICALVFKGISRLRMHMRRKHGAFEDSFDHVCDECGLTYDKYRSLIVHIQRKHNNQRKPEISQWYNCMFCPKMFNKRETYSRHMQRKHKVAEDGEDVQPEADVDLESYRNQQTGEITCKECPLVFSSMNHLKLHMRRKHNALRDNFRLKCKICNLSYDKIESLKRHIRRKHDQGSHCDVCNKQFDTREMYLNHSHTKMIRECSICGLIFASQGGLAKHLRCTHKMTTPKTVFCNICNEGFHDKRMLKPHYLKVHLKVSYTCMFCKKVFKAKESYRRHILFKHPTANRVTNPQQKCDDCGEMFDDEFELCKHINLTHRKKDENTNLNVPDIKKEEEDIKNNFQCLKCPDVYLSWEELKQHYELCHQHVTETQCQICGEIIPGNELQKHIKAMHTNTEMQCKFCEFKTNVKLSLTQHMLRHKNAATIHCDYTGCRYKTFYEGAMEKHKRRHADLGVKLQCTQCPFQSMNKYILKYHEEAHETGVKKYTCDQCDYATILPANLVQHKYKHSTEKRFKCDVCPFATKYNTSLRFHVKKKHCDLPTFS